MPSLQVKLDIDPVLRSLDRLGIQLAEKAITRSLNKTINSVKTDASRKVREELTLLDKDVKRDLAVRRARRGGLEAAVVVSVRATGLIKFRARQTARGTTVQVKRKGGRQRLPHAFIAKMPSGHRGVFTRRKGVSRLPINELFSTSVGKFLGDERVLSQIGEAAQERFTKELSSQVDFLLR